MALLELPVAEPLTQTSSDSLSRTRRWLVTLLAAIGAFAALDLIATAGGVTLAASGVFQGQPDSVVYALLVVSYVVWGAGMRVNLGANADLLMATGASTSALSKFLFDRTSARTQRRRLRRAAAAVGYAGTEILFELPFYALAFGASLASERIDMADALIFLVGSNVAAAGYEYVVGRLTHGYLGRRSRQQAYPHVRAW